MWFKLRIQLTNSFIKLTSVIFDEFKWSRNELNHTLVRGQTPIFYYFLNMGCFKDVFGVKVFRAPPCTIFRWTTLKICCCQIRRHVELLLNYLRNFLFNGSWFYYVWNVIWNNFCFFIQDVITFSTFGNNLNFYKFSWNTDYPKMPICSYLVIMTSVFSWNFLENLYIISFWMISITSFTN